MGNYKLYYSKILDKEQNGIKLKQEESVESSLEMCSFFFGPASCVDRFNRFGGAHKCTWHTKDEIPLGLLSL